MNDIERRKSEEEQTRTNTASLPFFSYREKDRVTPKKTFWLVLGIIVATGLLMAAIASVVRVNENTVKLSEIKNEISTLQKQKKELESELEKKNDMVAFEQYAMKELGMLKGDETQTEDREDRID